MTRHIQVARSRYVFRVCNTLFFSLLITICLYPLWYVFIQSVSASGEMDKAVLLPHGLTLKNYVDVMSIPGIFSAFGVSVARTLTGTFVTVTMCMWLGYLFTKEEMPARKIVYRVLLFTMYVSGGMIPGYIVIRAYGLLNNFWVYILPSAVSAYNVLLIKTYVEQLPASVEESAMLDGAGPARIFSAIILPMSLPIMATVAIYAAVGQWNAWFDNHIYTFSTKTLLTAQYMLYQYLQEADQLAQQLQEASTDIDSVVTSITPKGVRMTITMITVIPILMVYPFLQRYFIKGIVIGAVKG